MMQQSKHSLGPSSWNGALHALRLCLSCCYVIPRSAPFAQTHPLCTYSSNHLTERGKCFDGMLCIIIIPRDTIIIEECKKLFIVLLKTLFVVNCYFTLIITLENSLVETPNESFIFSQMMSLQSKFINSLNNRLQKLGKLSHQFF